MGTSAKDERILNVPIHAIIGAIRNIGVRSPDYSIKSENPVQGGVWFRIHHSMTATSWGEKITITLTEMGAQTKTEIFSEAAMPTQLVDFGKNKKVIAFLFDYINSNAPAFTGVAVQPPAAPAAVPQPTQPVQPTTPTTRMIPKFCSQCGSPLPAGARFCGGCGRKL